MVTVVPFASRSMIGYAPDAPLRMFNLPERVETIACEPLAKAAHAAELKAKTSRSVASAREIVFFMFTPLPLFCNENSGKM